MNNKVQFRRNSEEREAIIKCFIFPSLFSLDKDRLAWTNDEYDRKYKKARESNQCQEFIAIDIEKQEEIGCCVFKKIDYENQNIMISSRIFLENEEAPSIEKTTFFLNSLESFVFNNFDILKIYGSMDIDNPFISTLEEMGFIKEGCLKDNFYKKGKFIDQLIFSKFSPRSSFK